MVCMQCGTAVAAGVNFCPRCGAPLAFPAAPPSYPPTSAYTQYTSHIVTRPPRVESHLQTLGILWCVFAAYRAFAALIGIFVVKVISHGRFGGGSWPFEHDFYFGWGPGTGWMAGLIPVIAATTALMVGLGVFVGYSLLNRKPWGRTLAIIAAVLALFKIPFGTALGIYTLWVLAPGQSGAEYDAIAEPS
jgi:hypothetical protein